MHFLKAERLENIWTENLKPDATWIVVLAMMMLKTLECPQPALRLTEEEFRKV